MSLFEEWKKIVEDESGREEYQKFWQEFFEKEKNNYASILEDHTTVVSGKLGDLAPKFSMTPMEMVGFVDGINTSLKKEMDLESLKEESDITFDIDYEKLYFNMLDAKADWLYNLPQWDAILTVEKRKEIKMEYRLSKMASSDKIGRNDPCPCGSGKKYKKCCGK